MSEKDTDILEEGAPEGEPNDFMPGEDEFDDDLEAGEEGEAEAPLEPGKPGRRFGFSRSAAHEEIHPQGSVKGTHERVHIDDRASALFALVCAVGLVAILVGSYVAGAWPAGAVAPLPTNAIATSPPSPHADHRFGPSG